MRSKAVVCNVGGFRAPNSPLPRSVQKKRGEVHAQKDYTREDLGGRGKREVAAGKVVGHLGCQHFDQRLVRIMEGNNRPSQRRGSHLELSDAEITPVSYTHLDVYKRQLMATR